MSLSTKTCRLLITPYTKVYMRWDDRRLFAMNEEDLRTKYTKLYQRKMRILKYFAYKDELLKEAIRVGFKLPPSGAHIKFYLPMPPSWSKKKKRLMDFEPHTSRPDVSNLYKAFEDALLPEDMRLWDVRITKFWYSSVKGYIDVIYPDWHELPAITDVQLRKDPLLEAIHQMQLGHDLVDQDPGPAHNPNT